MSGRRSAASPGQLRRGPHGAGRGDRTAAALVAASEELRTTNEELMATNQELATTTQELSATNAELAATNRELVARRNEMLGLTIHQRAIVENVSTAVVLFDAAGRVTTWNHAAEKHFGVSAREALGRILWELEVPALEGDLRQRVRQVLTNRRPIRLTDVQCARPGGGTGLASCTVVPIVSAGHEDGAVLLFEPARGRDASGEEG